jgi:putative transposase
MHVHLVFVTKYRRNVFTKQILDELRIIFTDICTDFEACLVEFEGEGDHVHLLVNYPPKVAVSKLVNSLKGVSSRLVRKKGYNQSRKAVDPTHLRKKLMSMNFFISYSVNLALIVPFDNAALDASSQ